MIDLRNATKAQIGEVFRLVEAGVIPNENIRMWDEECFHCKKTFEVTELTNCHVCHCGYCDNCPPVCACDVGAVLDQIEAESGGELR